jgi:murein DD-endopeptidase MepM/ murein hydrolase activator NlpD
MKNKLLPLLLAFSFLFTLAFPVKAQSENYPYYVIESGDTLQSIADQFGISLTDLINYNNIANPDFVSVGTSLIIPGLEGIQGQVASTAVQLGENLETLTIKYQIAQSLLVKLNHITSPAEINVGTTLILPVIDDVNSKIPVGQMGSGQTLLESAAEANSSAWKLMLENNVPSQSALLPGDMLYQNVSEGSTEVSAIDAGLTAVTISPLPLVQGKTFEIFVKSPQNVTLNGSLNGYDLHFFPIDDQTQVALQGVYAMANPGLAPFTLSGTYADGKTFTYAQSILLLSGDYPTDDPITVDPSLIDPAVTQPEEDQVKQITTPATQTRYWDGMFQIPAVYNEYNATFGDRRSYNDGAYKSFHSGVDFAGGMGLPIYAPAAGKVVFTGQLTVRGNATIIDHGWGIYSAYFHQSEIDVNVGDMVSPGDVIGKVGNTGRVDNSDAFEGAGSHLHWEIWVNGVQVDPLEWLDKQYP